jgi:hypothetical protein
MRLLEPHPGATGVLIYGLDAGSFQDAPRGNQNALEHVLYTKVAIEERRQRRAFIDRERTATKGTG